MIIIHSLGKKASGFKGDGEPCGDEASLIKSPLRAGVKDLDRALIFSTKIMEGFTCRYHMCTECSL